MTPLDLARRFEGIGLAAQQVDLALQLCVVDLREGDREFDYQLNGSRLPLDLIMPLVLINPVVTARLDPLHGKTFRFRSMP